MREGLAGCPKVVYHRLRRALYFCRFCQDAFCRLRMKTSVVTQICHNDGAPPCSDHVEHQGLRRRLRGRRARRGVRVLVHALRGKGEAESGERRADVLAPEPRRTTRRRPRPRRPEQPRGVRWRASAALPAAGRRAPTLRTSLRNRSRISSPREFPCSRSTRESRVTREPRPVRKPIVHASLLFPAKTRAAFERERVEARTARAMLK